MTITSADIHQKQFKVRFRGFDIREVDAFLETVAYHYEALSRENEQIRKEVRRAQLEAQGYKEREETFKRAMLNSQEVIQQMKENARKSADLVIAEAEVRAEKILNRAHKRLAQLHEDISELKRQRMQIEVQIRSVIEAHTKLLDMGKEEAKEQDEVDAKVQLLKKS